MRHVASMAERLDACSTQCHRRPATLEPLSLEDAYAVQSRSWRASPCARAAAGRHQDGLHQPPRWLAERRSRNDQIFTDGAWWMEDGISFAPSPRVNRKCPEHFRYDQR